MSKLLSNQSGFSLVSVLVAAAIGGIIAAAMQTMLVSNYRFQRGVAVSGELSQMIDTVRLILRSSQTCQQSGLIGIQLSPLLSPSKHAVPVRLAVGSSQPIVAGVPFYSWNVEQFAITELTDLGVTAIGRRFLAKLDLQAKLIGKATRTNVEPKHSFLVEVTTSGDDRILECAMGDQSQRPMQCVRQDSGWRAWSGGRTYSVSCPLNMKGVTCTASYYDNNVRIGGGTVQYHGGQPANWNTTRTTCGLTVSDNGITQGRVVAECCGFP